MEKGEWSDTRGGEEPRGRKDRQDKEQDEDEDEEQERGHVDGRTGRTVPLVPLEGDFTLVGDPLAPKPLYRIH